MIKSKVAFLESWLFNQSELFQYFLIALNGWIKACPSKKPLLF